MGITFSKPYYMIDCFEWRTRMTSTKQMTYKELQVELKSMKQDLKDKGLNPAKEFRTEKEAENFLAKVNKLYPDRYKVAECMAIGF